MAQKKKTKKKKSKLSLEEKQKRRIQRKLLRDFRAFMRELGFTQVRADKIQISVDGRNGELDDIFIYENVIALVEYTTGKPDSSHVLKKKPLFDKILADVPRFLGVARKAYPQLHEQLKEIYDDIANQRTA